MENGKYTKSDIIDSIYDKTGIARKDIRAVSDLFIAEVKGALERGEVIELRKFGTFEVKVRKGRSRARNPKTGEPVEVKSHGAVIFRPGQELKQAVWNVTAHAGSSISSAPSASPAESKKGKTS